MGEVCFKSKDARGMSRLCIQANGDINQGTKAKLCTIKDKGDIFDSLSRPVYDQVRKYIEILKD